MFSCILHVRNTPHATMAMIGHKMMTLHHTQAIIGRTVGVADLMGLPIGILRSAIARASSSTKSRAGNR